MSRETQRRILGVPSHLGMWFLLSLLVASSAPLGAEGEARARAPFGFETLEIYRASDASASVKLVDLNRDGRQDVVYAYNSDTSIRLLVQRAGGAEEEPSPAPSGSGEAPATANEIQFDRRFAVEKIYTEKKIHALDVGDLDGDDRPDIAYYGDPPELVILYQGEKWGAKKETFPITDGLAGSGGLRLADLDGDHRLDLVLLGQGKTYVARQQESGSLSRPRAIYNAAQSASSVHVTDVNGDGSPDLVTLEPRSKSPVVVRFQEAGAYGPEIRFEMFPLADAVFRDLDADGDAELVTIQGNTRRVIAYRWGKREKVEETPLTDPRLVAFRPKAESSARRLTFGDVNGDGRQDVVVTYGDSAEADVLLQSENGGLLLPASSPTLSDVRGVVVGDFGGDGTRAVVVASGEERVLGWSRWLPGGRLSIPRTYPLEEEPLLLARSSVPGALLGRGGGKSRDGLLFVGEPKGRSSTYVLRLYQLEPEGELRSVAEVEISARARPNGLLSLDINGDSLTDCLLFVPFDNPMFFNLELQETKGEGEEVAAARAVFREVSKEKDFGIAQLAKLTPPAVSVARFPIETGNGAERDGDGGGRAADDILVSSKSHARALRLSATGRLEIVEQFSGRGAAGQIGGSVALELDGDPDIEVLVFDKAASSLDILDRQERGVYRQVRTIPMPGFKFGGFEVQDLNGDGKSDVVVVGSELLAVFYRGKDREGFVEMAQFDPGGKSFAEVEKFGRPERLGVADLNDDGMQDVIFSTQPKYYFTVLEPQAAGAPVGKLSPAFRFQLFEEKSFMRRGPSFGPREMVFGDVSGDGKDDLVMLIHDRILLYVQD